MANFGSRRRVPTGLIRVSTLAMIAAGLPAAARAQQAEPPVDSTATPVQSEGLQDIVVTARRVEERLQDVPLSITAFGTQALSDNQISQVQDIGAQVPNVITGKSSVPGAGQIAIRGVQGQSLPRIGLDNRVGVYLDGVYLARQQGQSFNLADIERIEVLKGPQGTLFGRNVTAGSVSIITAAPTGKFGMTFEAGLGSRSRQRYRGTVNLPEFGGFSVRLTYVHDEQDGDIRNLAAGYQPGPINVNITAAQIPAGLPTGDLPFNFAYNPKRAAKTFGSINSESVFAAVRYDGIDGLTADYKFDFTHQLETTSANHITGFDAGIGRGCVPAAIAFGTSINDCGTGTLALFGVANPTGGIVSPAPTSFTNKGGITGSFVANGAGGFSLGFTRPDAKSEFFTAPALVRSTGHNLTLNYDLNDKLAVRSITGYRRLRTAVQQALDGGSFSLLNTFLTAADPTRYPASAFPAGGTTPFSLGGAFQGQRQRQFSQELQLIGSPTEWLDFLAGGYYFRETGRSYQFTVITNAGTVGNLLGAVRGFGTPGNFVFPPQRGIPPFSTTGTTQWGLGSLIAGDNVNVRATSKAVFGRLTFKPIEQLDIVVGGRYTDDRKRARIPAFFAGLYDFNPFTPARDPVPTELNQKFDRFTYDGTITYHITPDINVYARYATAFLSGGAIRNTPFNPETTKSGEIGFKSEFFDRRVRFNAAAFVQKTKDYQYNQTGTIPLPAPLGTITATGLANLGSAKVKGFEAELTAVPVRGLTVGASAGYVDQQFSQVTTGGTPVPPPLIELAPKWTLQGSIQYDTPAVFGDAYLSIRLDANYRSKFGSSAQPLPTVANAAAGYPGFALPAALLNLYGLPATDAGRIAYTNLYNDNFQIGGFWLANARVSLVDLAVGGSKARLSAYAKNIFDEDRIVFQSYYGATSGATFVSKREFGIDLTVQF